MAEIRRYGPVRYFRSEANLHATFNIDPSRPTLGYFVSEWWPGCATRTTLSFGQFSAAEPQSVRSGMLSGGVMFADGLEKDYIRFDGAGI